MAHDIIDEYVIEEMKVVRDRINNEIDVMNRYEALSIGLVGAILALIFQYKISARVPLFVITILPALVGLYGYYRYRAHAAIVSKYNAYLIEIENRLRARDKTFVGLVSFYQGSRTRSRIRTLRTCFWVAIVALSLFLTVILQVEPTLLFASAK